VATDGKKIAFFCSNENDIGGYLCANMRGFQTLARDTSLEKYGLKTVVSVNEFFEQRTEKAYNMIKVSTIQLYASHPATANDKATLLALKGLYFIFEPYRNKQLTNPFWAVEMVSRGFHVWYIQHTYVRDAAKVTPVHDFTLSYQVHEQFHSLAQGLVCWYLIWHRHRKGHPKWKWQHCQVYRINENAQEDIHRKVRNQTRRNDVNCTIAEFLDFLSRALEAADSELWLRENGMANAAFPAGTCQTKGTDTLGLWVDPGETKEKAHAKLSFKNDTIPEDYDLFAEKLAQNWEKGFMWAQTFPSRCSSCSCIVAGTMLPLTCQCSLTTPKHDQQAWSLPRAQCRPPRCQQLW